MITFPNESAAYRAARKLLLDDEVALRRQMEAVAAARRALPPGGAVSGDYLFDGLDDAGHTARLGLGDLFRPGTDSLLIYHYMFPRHRADTRDAAANGEVGQLPPAEQPCPSCTALIDQLDAAALHFVAGGGNLGVVANTTLDRLQAVARDRGWRHVRLLSSAGSRFKRDYHGEDADGQQLPMTTVFQRDRDGTIRLSWASELVEGPSDPGQDHRAAGTIEPFWNMFDLLPGGRPDFQEQLEYGCCRR